MSNHLQNQTSPYLLQHANNPVQWYPWGKEAFAKAKAEDKPVFLSIGYSTCHWCHVMAHESFEDEQIAALLNEHFVSVKVDKEERPDIDSIYMEVCQAMTGGGGWPTSIFMTAEQKPFFAGTYFPKHTKMGMPGLYELLLLIQEKWETERDALLRSAEEITAALQQPGQTGTPPEEGLLRTAVSQYKRSFDARYGGFGGAPKFPAPHNLLFLLTQYEKTEDDICLQMAEKTLTQLYRGGIFDHIGYGFCRYSTDQKYLVPHFEKMLYDNALLILSYCQAYADTKTPLYRKAAEQTAEYVLREMTAPGGGFYSAQDADSEGVEGKYYLFTPEELTNLLGEETGTAFNRQYDITKTGNFEGKSIPNLLRAAAMTDDFDDSLPAVYEYRKNRHDLLLDDKIKTSWNSLMIAAFCRLYRVSGSTKYLNAAKQAQGFLKRYCCEEDTLFVSVREGRRSEKGFLEDYANNVFALLELYEATLDGTYLQNARHFFQKAVVDFFDERNGGFYLYGEENERLILRPKETYDGAVPSGNSMMAHNAVRLYHITGEEEYKTLAQHQLAFLSAGAKGYPMGHAMSLLALSDYLTPPARIVIAAKDGDDLTAVSPRLPYGALLHRTPPTREYPLKEDKTTYYVCKNHACLPPVNRLEELERA